MNHQLSPLVILLALVLAGCEPETHPTEVAASSTLVEESTNYADPTEQQQFKEALKSAGVAHVFKMRDGKEYISWKASENEAVARIEASLFGPPLPSGRNFSAGAQRQGEFKAWLTANGIPFTTQVSRGREYVVWGEEYAEKVNTLPFSFPAMQSPNPSLERTASGLRPPAAPQVKR